MFFFFFFFYKSEKLASIYSPAIGYTARKLRIQFLSFSSGQSNGGKDSEFDVFLDNIRIGTPTQYTGVKGCGDVEVSSNTAETTTTETATTFKINDVSLTVPAAIGTTGICYLHIPYGNEWGDWTIGITAQGITASVGDSVVQGAVTGILKTALQNEYTLTINAAGITENAGVAVSQGSAQGTLKTKLQNEYTLTITSTTITESAGVVVSQVGGAAGTLKTALTGAGTVTVIIQAASGVIFTDGADLTIGTSTPVVAADILGADHSGKTTSVVIEAASGVIFTDGADLTIGSTTPVVANDITGAEHSGKTTSFVIETAATGVTVATGADIVIGTGGTKTTVAHATINTATTSAVACGSPTTFTNFINSVSVKRSDRVFVATYGKTMMCDPACIKALVALGGVGVVWKEGSSMILMGRYGSQIGSTPMRIEHLDEGRVTASNVIRCPDINTKTSEISTQFSNIGPPLGLLNPAKPLDAKFVVTTSTGGYIGCYRDKYNSGNMKNSDMWFNNNFGSAAITPR